MLRNSCARSGRKSQEISDCLCSVYHLEIYWHGIGRTKEELLNSESSRDKIIFRKKLTDEEQIIWFEKHHMKLIRITDKQIKSGEFTL
jgi:hypothetical protein